MIAYNLEWECVTRSTTDGHLNRFQFFTITNNTMMNIPCKCLFEQICKFLPLVDTKKWDHKGRTFIILIDTVRFSSKKFANLNIL